MHEKPPVPDSLWNRLPEDTRPGIKAIIEHKDAEIARLTVALRVRSAPSANGEWECSTVPGDTATRLTSVTVYDALGTVVWTERDDQLAEHPSEGDSPYSTYIRGNVGSTEMPSDEPDDLDEPFIADS